MHTQGHTHEHKHESCHKQKIDFNKRNLGAEQTADFVATQLKTGASILDVGSGTGCVAKPLLNKGFNVLAIDGNVNAVAEASENGVETKLIDFLEFSHSEQFDCLLFSRSLHHIHPPQKAIEKSLELLKDGGKIILDDFAIERIETREALFYYGVKSLVLADLEAGESRGPKLENGQIPQDLLADLRSHHEQHGVLRSTEFMPLLKEKFVTLLELDLPYLYRYFQEDISEKQSERLYEWERRLCTANQLNQVGIRFVGVKKS